MNKWILLQVDRSSILAIIEGNEKDIEELLPFHIRQFDTFVHDYSLREAKGKEEKPFLYNGCKICDFYNNEFNDCCLNGNCDKTKEFWDKITRGYFENDEELIDGYLSDDKKLLEKVADFIAYKSYDHRDYKLINFDKLENYIIKK